MLKIEFSTDDIIQFLHKNSFPVYQKTLIYDDNIKKPVGIFTPTENKNNKLVYGTFSSFIHHNIINNILLLEIVPITNSTFFVKTVRLGSENSFYVHSTLNLSLPELQNLITQYKLEDMYITGMITAKQTKKSMDHILTLDIPIIFLDDFKFPLPTKPYILNNMAIIFDPTLDQTYQESLMLYNIITENKILDLTVHLYALPLKTHQFEKIINTYNIIHYAGHMTQKGFLINKRPFIPQLKQKPQLLFLNNCETPLSIIKNFASQETCLLFSIQKQIDVLVCTDQIKNFYLALLLGHRIGDIFKTLQKYSFGLVGWGHFYFKGKLHDY